MGNLVLKNFTLVNYDEKNRNHLDTLILLGNDELTRKYLFDIYYYVKSILNDIDADICNALYVIYQGDTPLGLLLFTGESADYEVRLAILPNYRHQHIASTLMQEFTTLVLDSYPHIQNINAIISPDNIYSIKVVLASGFKRTSPIKYSLKRQ